MVSLTCSSTETNKKQSDDTVCLMCFTYKIDYFGFVFVGADFICHVVDSIFAVQVRLMWLPSFLLCIVNLLGSEFCCFDFHNNYGDYYMLL
jgi:hypothetical protein